MGVGPRAPISNGITFTFMFGISKLPCQILVLFYFFLILIYPLFRHEGKQNILSGKGFYLSVPQWHLVFSHIFHDAFVLKSNSMLCLSFSITSSGLCSYHFYFTCISYFLHITQRIFILRSSFHNLFGLTCCIHLTHDTLFSFFTQSTLTVFLGLNHCFVIGSYSLFLCGHYQGFSCSF